MHWLPEMEWTDSPQPEQETEAHLQHATTDLEAQQQFKQLYMSLLEILELEHKHQPVLTLQNSQKDGNEISVRMRNGSAHVLRCLKVWYDLPSQIFFNAVNIMDRFLTVMKAQPKHLSCIAVSAFHLSCFFSRLHTTEKYLVPDTQDLTNISQAKCGANDVSKMERIMLDRLCFNFQMTEPTTPLTFLRLFYTMHCQLAKIYIPNFPTPQHPSILSLIQKLEIMACDSVFTMYRPSVLALSLLAVGLGSKAHHTVHKHILVYLRQMCKMDNRLFEQCFQLVSRLIEQYDNQSTSPHRQRLVWKLSTRTLRLLRPSQKFKAKLPTIQEFRLSPQPESRLPVCDSYVEEPMQFDYDQDFPPLPPPSCYSKSPLKSTTHKKLSLSFPYPKFSPKQARSF